MILFYFETIFSEQLISLFKMFSYEKYHAKLTYMCVGLCGARIEECWSNSTRWGLCPGGRNIDWTVHACPTRSTNTGTKVGTHLSTNFINLLVPYILHQFWNSLKIVNIFFINDILNSCSVPMKTNWQSWSLPRGQSIQHVFHQQLTYICSPAWPSVHRSGSYKSFPQHTLYHPVLFPGLYIQVNFRTSLYIPAVCYPRNSKK